MIPIYFFLALAIKVTLIGTAREILFECESSWPLLLTAVSRKYLNWKKLSFSFPSGLFILISLSALQSYGLIFWFWSAESKRILLWCTLLLLAIVSLITYSDSFGFFFNTFKSYPYIFILSDCLISLVIITVICYIGGYIRNYIFLKFIQNAGFLKSKHPRFQHSAYWCPSECLWKRSQKACSELLSLSMPSTWRNVAFARYRSFYCLIRLFTTRHFTVFTQLH